MKKVALFGVVVLGIAVSGCSQNKPVEVVKATDTSTMAIPKAAPQVVELPANLPANATAICRDGSYSTSKENACSGNGGAVSFIGRYHSD